VHKETERHREEADVHPYNVIARRSASDDVAIQPFPRNAQQI
jgi:hypothetical protein